MKNLLSLIVCFCLLFVSMSTIAIAYHSESLIITDTIEDSWIVDVKGENFNIRDNADKKFYYQGSEFAINYNCYQFLDTAQKQIYDSILENSGKLSFTINFDNGVFLYSNFTQDYFTEVMMALCTDRPDLFYYAGYGIESGQLYANYTHIKSIKYIVSVYDSALYTENNLPGYYNALIEAVPQVPVDTTNRYQFVKSVHDYLANTVYYPDLNSTDYVKSAHDAYGALVEGRAVCQGYSDAFKLICDYYKIPCVCISGTSDGVGHMWNAVQMDDGKWYLLDITWDDQESRIYYDFFLVGLSTKDTYFGKKAFNVSHVSDGSPYLPALNYSLNKYTTTSHNTGFKATYNSITKDEKYLIRSFFDASDTLVYYNGMYVETNNLITGDKFVANNVDWTMVLIGDCDDVVGDGYCDYYDYYAVEDKALKGTKVVTVSDMAADADCDGVIDAIDVMIIERAASGSNTKIIIE